MKRCIACGAPLWETPLLTLDNMPASAQHMPDKDHVDEDQTYGTLGGGILTGKYRELKEYGVDDNRNRFYPYFKEPLFSKVMLLLRTMDQISEERNVPLSQIALNWTLQKPFISSCIIGAQSRDKIEENCKVFEWKLSDDEMQLLEQALKKTII